MKKFIRTEIKALPEMAALARTSPSANAVLMTLMSMAAGEENLFGCVMVSNKVLCEALNYSNKTVSNAVQFLKECGFIGIAKVGQNNAYIVNPDIMNMRKKDERAGTDLDNIKVIITTDEAKIFKEEIRNMLATKKAKQVTKKEHLNNWREIKVSEQQTKKKIINMTGGKK